MKKAIFPGSVVVSSSFIILAFFMPWARVGTSVMTVSKQLTSNTAEALKLKEMPVAGKVVKGVEKLHETVGGAADIGVKSVVKGYEIPRNANNRISKISMSILQVLFKEFRDLDKKSYLVYLAPLSAVVLAGLAVAGLRYKLSILLMTVLSGGASIGGIFNIMTADESGLPVKIVIEKGVWYTVCAFLFIFIIGALWLLPNKREAAEQSFQPAVRG